MPTKRGAIFDRRATLVATMFHRFQVTVLALKEASVGRQSFMRPAACFYRAMYLLNRGIFPVCADVYQRKARPAAVGLNGDDVLIILGADF